jgi:amino-acid N-acetyltransferase
MSDAIAICGLVNYHAERGKMLHRSLEDAYNLLQSFLVAEDADGCVVGCVAVATTWADLAEIKSLAVAPDRQRCGVGSRLLEAAVEDARRLEVKKLFALTYEKAFFSRHGFEIMDRQTLPEKVWRECIACPKQECCDETAMVRRL